MASKGSCWNLGSLTCPKTQNLQTGKKKALNFSSRLYRNSIYVHFYHKKSDFTHCQCHSRCLLLPVSKVTRMTFRNYCHLGTHRVSLQAGIWELNHLNRKRGKMGARKFLMLYISTDFKQNTTNLQVKQKVLFNKLLLTFPIQLGVHFNRSVHELYKH